MNPKKAKILLVEDDLIQIKMYQAKFTNAGLNLIVAITGHEGLELIKKESPTLILLDVKLEDIDGFEILKKIKRDPMTKKIPVFLLTNIRKVNGDEKGRKLGAEKFIMKAKILPDELIEEVKNRLEQI